MVMNFPNNLTKIENHTVCNGCWVSKDYYFDPGRLGLVSCISRN